MPILSINNKIVKRQIKNKDGSVEASRTSDIENQVAQAILDIQNNADAATKEALMKLYITGAKEFDVGGKNAIVISIPPPQVTQWQALQTKTVRELEKKFSGKHVILVGSRKIMPKEARKAGSKCYKQKRPVSRSVAAVHEAALADICYPAQIIGKRIRHKQDGQKLIKAFLDKSSQTNVEHKLITFSAVYKRLTGKNVIFEFPEYEL